MIWKTIEVERKNERFAKSFKQRAEEIISSEDFIFEVQLIRKTVGIPINGFEKFDDFINWLIIENNENKFLCITDAFKNLKTISAKPKYFLEDVVKSLLASEGDEYPTGLYFLNDGKSFGAIINEKPFPGIVHYVLWNKLLIPETNQLQLTFDALGYPILRFGPKATVEDFREMLPILSNLFQKRFGIKKGTVRFRNKYKTHKKILSIKPKDKNGLLYYDTNLDAADELAGHEIKSKKELKRHQANVRQIKSRSKKRIN